MTQQEILNQSISKTAKMRQLFELGLTRQETATLMGVGYGFVQNVYAKTYPDRISSSSIFKFNRTFGIEIEAFNISRYNLCSALRAAGIEAEMESYNHRTRPHWKIVTDSSVRGTNTFELVSPILKGEEGIAELKKVTEVLKAKNVKINKSCGLHIHLDAGDLKIGDWKRIYKNYIKLEPTIDSFMPRSRKGNINNYCRSMVKPDYERRIDNASTLKDIERAITNRNRQSKLNSQAYWVHKTVEFRQHSGTIEFEKISNWLMFLSRFVNYSKKNLVTDGSFDGIAKFCPADLMTYLKTRKEQLS